MRRPDFLVIGAMKAGSTTIYNDLAGSASVFLGEKEVGTLLSPAMQTESGVRAYEALFVSAAPWQVVGDISADYAKLSQSVGLAETALRILGPGHRIVYSVRNPVDRLVSHHHHALARNEITDPVVDSAVRGVPELISYSSYASQARPFLDAVGPEQVHLIAFERYMSDRTIGFAELAAFLGLRDHTTQTDPTRAFNAANDVHVAVGRMGSLVRTQPYRKLLRPLLPSSVRDRLRKGLLPPMPPRPAPPTAETVDRILDAVEPEVEELRKLGFEPPTSWGREATHERYAALRTEA